MSNTIREYQGPTDEDEPVIKEYRGEKEEKEEKEDAELNTTLNESQVEALISAIESSPLNTNGKTSELAVQAALYLTGDEPQKREKEFIDQLVHVNDNKMLRKELDAFASIYKDFSASTVGEDNDPQVIQTKYRLKKIVSLLSEAIDYSEQLDSEPMRLQKSTIIANDKKVIAESNDYAEKPKTSVFDSNWFRFAAFSVLAVVILLVIVMFVQWLRMKHESSSEEKSIQAKKSNNPSETLI